MNLKKRLRLMWGNFITKITNFFLKIGRFFKRVGQRIITFPRRVFSKQYWQKIGLWIKDFPKHIVKFSRWFFTSTTDRRAPIINVVIFFLLIVFGFMYVYPLLYMVSYSFMSEQDVIDPLVKYIPTKAVLTNYLDALKTLNFWPNLGRTILVAIFPALLQCGASSLIAYALSRFKFRGKNLLLGLVLLTFVVPQQVTMIPQVVLLSKLKLIDSIFSYIILALFGQGIRSAVFILLFYSFFNQLPKSIEESAKIDGANAFSIFFLIAVPSAFPAYILTFLLSFVWYYNETVLATLYLGSDITTLTLQLEVFKSAYEAMVNQTGQDGKSINEAIYMAGTLITILPLLIIYFITQRFFVEGIDQAGITGE